MAAATKQAAAIGTDSQHRSARIDGLRAVAATLVLTFHVWWILSPKGVVQQIADGGDVAALANSAVLRFGTVGVSLFYVLSGFLLYRPFVAARIDDSPQPNPIAYLVRRAARILPAYWAALVLIGLLAPETNVFTLHGLKAYFLFGQIYSFHDLRQGFPLPPMWTICVEVTFYIFLPVWAWFAEGIWRLARNRLRAEFTMLALLALLSILWKINVVKDSGVASAFQPKLIALPASLDLFAAGMALAVMAEVTRRHGWDSLARIARPAWAWWLAALALLGLIAATASPNALIPVSWQTGTLLAAVLKVPMAAALVFPVVLSSERGGLIRRTLGSRPVAWVGLVSYGLYLWHSWVISRLADIDAIHHPSLMAWPLVWSLALVLSLCCAAASWYLIERSAIGFGHRLSSRAAAGGTSSSSDG